MSMDRDATGYFGKAWLHPTIVGAAVLAVASGYGQFSVTTVLGEVAEAFGEVDRTGGEAARVGLSTTVLGAGLAAIRLAGIGSLPLASLADRRGRRSILWLAAGGLILTAVAATMPAYWPFVAIVALARPLLAGTNTVATVVAAEQAVTAERAKGIAVAEAGYAVGSGAVVIVHGVGGEALGFRGVLALSVLFLGLLPWLSRRIEESSLFAAASETVSERKRLGAIRPGLRRRVALVSLLAAAVALVTGPAFTFIFLYGENVLGLSAGFMAGLVVATGVLALPGLLLGRWAADHLGRRVTAGAATALLALSATAAYSGGTLALAGGYAVAVALGAVYGPAAGALLAEVFPTTDRSTAAGWAAAAGVIGAVAGLAAFGALVDVLGSFAVAAAVLWLPLIPTAGLYALLPETKDEELQR